MNNDRLVNLIAKPPLDGQLITPYLIAEAGVNHEGDFEVAKRQIYEAAEGGADAIKFQSYKAETLAAKHSPSYWDLKKEPSTSQRILFKKYDKFWKKEYEQLAEICENVGITFISTPFDFESAGFLSELMSVFKIASSDITNLPFLDFIAEYGKPIILSTGASYLWEIFRVTEIFNKKGIPFSLLHCVLNYPTDEKNANLGMILDLKRRFPERLIGYSDHTLPDYGLSILQQAWFLGARIIEKHFTHDKTLSGNDHYHAMDKNDIVDFRKACQRSLTLFGSQVKYSTASEVKARENARRSIFAARDLKIGHILRVDDVKILRPGTGIHPALLNDIVGLKIEEDIKSGEIISLKSIGTKSLRREKK